jgi:hypothetical protein
LFKGCKSFLEIVALHFDIFEPQQCSGHQTLHTTSVKSVYGLTAACQQYKDRPGSYLLLFPGSKTTPREQPCREMTLVAVHLVVVNDIL